MTKAARDWRHIFGKKWAKPKNRSAHKSWNLKPLKNNRAWNGSGGNSVFESDFLKWIKNCIEMVQRLSGRLPIWRSTVQISLYLRPTVIGRIAWRCSAWDGQHHDQLKPVEWQAVYSPRGSLLEPITAAPGDPNRSAIKKLSWPNVQMATGPKPPWWQSFILFISCLKNKSPIGTMAAKSH